jgi:lipid-A-disaccharide synthase
VHDRTHAALSAATAAIVASGTATVEAALLGAPMVVVYRLSPWTYRLGRRFVRVPYYAMVNLIGGRRVVPELIQSDFTAERVLAEMLPLIDDTPARRQMQSDLAAVREKLGGPGASGRAADAVAPFLNGKSLDTSVVP